MPRPPTPPHVLVALDKSITSRTKKLYGILQATRESGAVELKIMDDGRDLSPELVDREIAAGVKAFIVGASGVAAGVARICERGVPVVTISQSYALRKNACRLHTDNASVAREAVRILTPSRRVRSFAYYPAMGNPQWSRERQTAFEKEVERRQPHARVLVLSPESAAKDLLSLDRPAGVLAANDTYAAELLKTAQDCGLRVPADISLVGVDNEELLCESVSTPITSIEPGFEREGYEAMRAAIGLINGRSVPSHVPCGINQVVTRKSTYNPNTAEALVDRALDHINEKATSGLTVEELCAHLKVSRCLLDLRFSELKGTTPHNAIIERRLTSLKKLLRTTDLPIAVVCKRCGFGSENHPKKLFRQHYGMPMREFRAKSCV